MMGSAQYTTVSGQVNLGHAPPTVSSARAHNFICLLTLHLFLSTNEKLYLVDYSLNISTKSYAEE